MCDDDERHKVKLRFLRLVPEQSHCCTGAQRTDQGNGEQDRIRNPPHMVLCLSLVESVDKKCQSIENQIDNRKINRNVNRYQPQEGAVFSAWVLPEIVIMQ